MKIQELRTEIKRLKKEQKDDEAQLYHTIKELHPGFSSGNPDAPGYEEYISGIMKLDEKYQNIDNLEYKLKEMEFEREYPSVAKKIRPLPRLTPGWVVLRTIEEEEDDNPYNSSVRVLTSVAAITQTEEAARSFVSDHKLQDEIAGNFSVRYHVMRAGDDFEDYYGHAE